MNIFKFFRRPTANKNFPVVVLFAGGMGTQIIQAAVYFSMKNTGRQVYGDVSYFDRSQKLAVVGNTGELTHWGWQLDLFGLSPASFDAPPPGLNKRNSDRLGDGARMTELGLKALSQPEIQKCFKVTSEKNIALSAEAAGYFLCIHIRRGDYVNVASHLITDSEFIRLSRKFSGLVSNVIVISDSPIGAEFRNALASCFKKISFLDNIDAYTSHCIMRNARILFCSNSSFSLTAAALNPDALAIIPRQWYGDDDRHIEEPIHAGCLFEIMENGGH